MFYLKRPPRADLEALIWKHRKDGFSYDAVGASRTETAPAGYDVDRTRYFLGHGRECFERARRAIAEWKMFNLSWCTLIHGGESPVDGLAVGALFNHFGFWSFHISRVVYLLDERGPIERYGFAYGTLLPHGEAGEEKFFVEWNDVDEGVWFEIYAFSKPNRMIVRLGYPVVRVLQAKFRMGASTAMIDAVGTNDVNA